MAIHTSDSDIQKNILAELKWNPEVNETDIGVIVKDGAVTLTGTVPSYAQKSAANRVAMRIKGVRAIADEIEVKLARETEGSDKDIAERISRAFEWNSTIPANAVQAEVRDGFVTLSGDLDWQYQRESAQRLVEAMKGVRMVINNTKLRKRISARDIKHEIVKSLHRHASLEANRITVVVTEGTVTLNGTVDSYFEKNLIRSAAWMAEGVTRVVDNLFIAPSYHEAA